MATNQVTYKISIDDIQNTLSDHALFSIGGCCLSGYTYNYRSASYPDVKNDTSKLVIPLKLPEFCTIASIKISVILSYFKLFTIASLVKDKINTKIERLNKKDYLL